MREDGLYVYIDPCDQPTEGILYKTDNDVVYSYDVMLKISCRDQAQMSAPLLRTPHLDPSIPRDQNIGGVAIALS